LRLARATCQWTLGRGLTHRDVVAAQAVLGRASRSGRTCGVWRIVAIAWSNGTRGRRKASGERCDVAITRCRAELANVIASLAGLAAGTVDYRAVVDRIAGVQLDTALADVQAVGLLHAARAVQVAYTRLVCTVGSLCAGLAGLDAAFAWIRRTYRRRAGRDGCAGHLRIRIRIAASRAVGSRAGLRYAGLCPGRVAGLRKGAAAGLRCRVAGLCSAVTGLRKRRTLGRGCVVAGGSNIAVAYSG